MASLADPARARKSANYAFVVVGVVFCCLLAAAGQRGAPSVLLQPLEAAFGWDRATISLSGSIGILCYGLMGPFAAALMQRFGIRHVITWALLLMSLSVAASYFMTAPWQLILLWGVVSGIGSGCVAMVLAATVVARWFSARRGLIMGIMTASTASGTLIFIPGLAWIVEHGGWQPVVLAVAAGAAVMIPFVLWLLPEWPSDVGLRRWGAPAEEADPKPDHRNLVALSFGTLLRAMKTRPFWYLFATFFVCGFTTNGLVGMHLIAFCGDHGIVEVQAAGLMVTMGIFDLIGTTGSGWLTDRFDPRKLLFVYYGLRGLSLIYLPYSDFSFYELGIFAVFYGLDWIATVPPTLKLVQENFGMTDSPIIFGWIAAGHQIGAAAAASFAGWMHKTEGNYVSAFVIAGFTGIFAALISLLIARPGKSAGASTAPAAQAA
jgi:MFS family permease